jgi:hypothetical protein
MLSSGRDWRRLPLYPAREERQVVAQNINRNGRHTKDQRHPHAPIAVGARPVRPLDRRENFAIAAFVAVMTMYDFTHLF